MIKTTIWSALTADREDHHSVSNVLGALLMGSQVGEGLLDKDGPWAADYLLALVQACGVKGHREQHAPRVNGDRQCWVSNELRAEIGAAVLVDDMADNILSRAMIKAGEDTTWRKQLGNDRQEIGDWACHVHAHLGIQAR